MKKYLFYSSLFLSFYSPAFAKLKTPEILKNPQWSEILEDFNKINDFKMPDAYHLFFYSQKFAKIVNKSNDKNGYGGVHNLSLKNAKSFLAPNVIAVGLTIKKDTNEDRKNFKFAEYICKIHLFVPNNPDYLLPPGDFGSWFSYQKLNHEMEDLIPGEIDYDYGHYFSMRHFMANTRNDDKENGYDGASMILGKYKINAFPGVTYLEYVWPSFYMPKNSDTKSIWIEKKSGPDYHQTHYEPPHQKYFYHFPLPPELFQQSCKYIQKAFMNYEFNTFGYFDDPLYNYPNFFRTNKIYNCEQ